MELTDIEKKIIKTYRNGACVKVTFFTHAVSSYEDAMEKAKCFGGVTNFYDFTASDGISFINFENSGNERVNFNIFLETDRH